MIDSSLLRDTERFLHEKIPLSLAMGVQVESHAKDGLILTAPLAANHNHLGTAFGGSLSALATLAGYALLWLELGDREAHIVIHSSTIRYRRPVTGNIRAIGQRPDASTLAAFKTQFAKTGKARITLKVSIEQDGFACVDFEGVYVALR
ncbi:thioesterase domain-containing protein [soil metagenome]